MLDENRLFVCFSGNSRENAEWTVFYALPFDGIRAHHLQWAQRLAQHRMYIVGFNLEDMDAFQVTHELQTVSS